MQKRIPTNSYRIQLSDTFKFQEVRALVPYLSRLGIDMIYLSPFFEIEKGSLNPYKIVSANCVNPRFGGEKEFDRFTQELKKYNIMHMIDLVPNHMGASTENPWWRDVLKNGRYSEYADFFDIDWKRYDGKVLLPILHDNSEIKKEGGHLNVDGKIIPLRAGTEKLTDKDELLEKQNYILEHWKETHKAINYRRFFDISELVGLKMEKSTLFKKYHEKVFEWIKEDKIQGLRIDHPDGLSEPSRYLKKLYSKSNHIYTVCEKILQFGEKMRADWKSDGTVGYDALNSINSLFVDTKNEKDFTEIFQSLAEETEDPILLLAAEKKKYIEKYLESELDTITTEIYNITIRKNERFNVTDLKEALVEWLSLFPIYRSYVGKRGVGFFKRDKKIISKFLHAKLKLKHEYKVFFAQKILKWSYRKTLLRIQQLMPAVFAKGFEDTFLYLYTRLTSLNEVGGTPMKFGLSIRNFHKITKERQESHPNSMVTTSTHDTKRSEDVRMRISVLSERPKLFKKMIKRWRKLNGVFEDKNFDYFFYQTLLGFWPATKPTIEKKKELKERLTAYFIKSACEAKRHTDWIDHNQEYEKNLLEFVNAIISKSATSPFWKSFYLFLEEIDLYGKYNSLSALIIKMGMPGVVDFYQGHEFWRYDLVDPDNRRRVNFEIRENMLDKLEETEINSELLLEWFYNPDDSMIKMYLMQKGLKVRREFKELFVKGRYVPLMTRSSDLIGFSRIRGSVEVRVYAARFYSKHLGDVQIPFKKGFIDVFTNEASTPLPFSIQIKKLT